MKDIAGSVYVSPYYFHRLYYLIAHETIGDYIRKRRLTLATSEIVKTDTKIIDIALNYAYSSHEAFTRAFTAYFGVSPYEFRKTRKINSLLFKGPLRDACLEHMQAGISIEPKIVAVILMIITGWKAIKAKYSNIDSPK